MTEEMEAGEASLKLVAPTFYLSPSLVLITQPQLSQRQRADPAKCLSAGILVPCPMNTSLGAKALPSVPNSQIQAASLS